MLIRFCGAQWLTLLVFALLGLPAVAQPTGGLRVGGNAAFFVNPQPLAKSAEAKPGLVGGVFLSLPLGERIAIQPEVQYSQLGTRFKDPVSVVNGRDRLLLDEVTVPLLLKIFLVKRKIHLHAGPQIAFVVRADEERTTANTTTRKDVRDTYRATDYGIVAGLGANLPLRLTLDLRYVAGLADLVSDPALAATRAKNSVGNLNQHALQLLIGLRLF